MYHDKEEYMFFFIEDILNTSEVQRVDDLIRRAEFVNGAISAAGVGKETKSNREMEVSDSYVSLVQLLDHALELSQPVNMRLLPRFLTNPIVNRYDVGMFYAEHIDAPIQGGVTQFGRSPGRFGQSFIRTDYSMTLFLSDPGTYDGGELELRLLGESKLIKLRAGSAICYSTGIPHSVRQVTRGFRIAAIYWFQSLIRNVQIRSELWDQYCLEDELARAGQRELAEKAASVRNNMVRYLAEL
jgi:PKHD-type hydroxylase